MFNIISNKVIAIKTSMKKKSQTLWKDLIKKKKPTIPSVDEGEEQVEILCISIKNVK